MGRQVLTCWNTTHALQHLPDGGPVLRAQTSPAHLVLLLQATQLEITAGANGRDTYDISLVVRLDFSSRAEPACSVACLAC